MSKFSDVHCYFDCIGATHLPAVEIRNILRMFFTRHLQLRYMSFETASCAVSRISLEQSRELEDPKHDLSVHIFPDADLLCPLFSLFSHCDKKARNQYSFSLG
jgi:hypothetical protein